MSLVSANLISFHCSTLTLTELLNQQNPLWQEIRAEKAMVRGKMRSRMRKALQNYPHKNAFVKIFKIFIEDSQLPTRNQIIGHMGLHGFPYMDNDVQVENFFKIVLQSCYSWTTNR